MDDLSNASLKKSISQSFPELDEMMVETVLWHHENGSLQKYVDELKDERAVIKDSVY